MFALNEVDRVIALLHLLELKFIGLQGHVEIINQLGEIMSAEVDRLTQEVEENKTVVGSAVTLLSGLATRLREIQGDSVKVGELAAELDAKNRELSEAIVANTVP